MTEEGICFGFKIIEHSDEKYELELFFNDMEPNTTMGIPNQRLPPAEQTNKYPLPFDAQMYLN